jgi:hypothetical protein
MSAKYAGPSQKPVPAAQLYNRPSGQPRMDGGASYSVPGQSNPQSYQQASQAVRGGGGSAPSQPEMQQAAAARPAPAPPRPAQSQNPAQVRGYGNIQTDVPRAQSSATIRTQESPQDEVVQRGSGQVYFPPQTAGGSPGAGYYVYDPGPKQPDGGFFKFVQTQAPTETIRPAQTIDLGQTDSRTAPNFITTGGLEVRAPAGYSPVQTNYSPASGEVTFMQNRGPAQKPDLGAQTYDFVQLPLNLSGIDRGLEGAYRAGPLGGNQARDYREAGRTIQERARATGNPFAIAFGAGIAQTGELFAMAREPFTSAQTKPITSALLLFGGPISRGAGRVVSVTGSRLAYGVARTPGKGTAASILSRTGTGIRPIATIIETARLATPGQKLGAGLVAGSLGLGAVAGGFGPSVQRVAIEAPVQIGVFSGASSAIGAGGRGVVSAGRSLAGRSSATSTRLDAFQGVYATRSRTVQINAAGLSRKDVSQQASARFFGKQDGRIFMADIRSTFSMRYRPSVQGRGLGGFRSNVQVYEIKPLGLTATQAVPISRRVVAGDLRDSLKEISANFPTSRGFQGVRVQRSRAPGQFGISTNAPKAGQREVLGFAGPAPGALREGPAGADFVFKGAQFPTFQFKRPARSIVLQRKSASLPGVTFEVQGTRRVSLESGRGFISTIPPSSSLRVPAARVSRAPRVPRPPTADYGLPSSPEPSRQALQLAPSRLVSPEALPQLKPGRAQTLGSIQASVAVSEIQRAASLPRLRSRTASASLSRQRTPQVQGFASQVVSAQEQRRVTLPQQQGFSFLERLSTFSATQSLSAQGVRTSQSQAVIQAPAFDFQSIQGGAPAFFPGLPVEPFRPPQFPPFFLGGDAAGGDEGKRKKKRRQRRGFAYVPDILSGAFNIRVRGGKTSGSGIEFIRPIRIGSSRKKRGRKQ